MMANNQTTFMDSIYDYGAKYIDHGLSIFPCSINTKTPLNSWKKCQTVRATHDDLEDWIANGALTAKGARSQQFNLCMATGRLSGIVVVDCDDQVAINKARELSLWSPVRVRTRRGMHLYFKHPGYDVKTNAHSLGWHRIDVRGDGGYVLMPPSVSQRAGQLFYYTWEVDPGCSLDDLPVLPDLSRIARPPSGHVPNQGDAIPEVGEDGSINLAGFAAHSWSGAKASIYQQCEAYVAQVGKLCEGDGRNPWMTRFVGEQIALRVYGDELMRACVAFNETFFADQLDVNEIQRIITSLMARDRQTHPDRYDADGNPIDTTKQAQTPDPSWKNKAIVVSRLNELRETTSIVTRHFLDPLIPVGKFIQIHGAPGTGKSMVLANLLYAASLGQSWAGFVTDEAPRVLYLDYDNPIDTTIERFEGMINTYGPSDNFVMFNRYDAPSELNMRTERGLQEVYDLVAEYQPQVIVIDSVRNAWPGMEENSSDGWTVVNTVCGALRNAGYTVIIVHHSNKPDARTGRLGSAAGSLAQLSLVDLQAQIVRVMGGASNLDPQEQELLIQAAHQKNAIINEVIFDRMVGYARDAGTTLRGCYQVLYGKIRGDESNCNPVCLALTVDDHDRMIWIGDKTNRVKAMALREGGMSIAKVAQEMEMAKATITKWDAKRTRSIFEPQ